LVEGLESLLLDRSPDLLVVLDGDLKVIKASAGLRSTVPMVAPGEEFLRSLDDKSQARLRQAWWPLIWPSTFLAVTVLAFIMLGDAIRDAFDPRSR